MKNLYLTLLLAWLSINLYGQNQIVLNADLGKHTISKHIYGHFSEHLGRCIYDGIYVGENNPKIPTVDGVRKDVIDALIKLKIPSVVYQNSPKNKFFFKYR